MSEQVTGVVERITHHNPETGYCVLKVAARGHRDLVAVVGSAQQIVAGEYVTATGDWVNDKNWGLQFKAAEIKTTPPHTPEGIVKYLGSGLVKGIGPGYARKIVDAFGERTLDVIDKSPEHLRDVKGIGPKLIEKIRTSWAEQRESRKILVFLQSHGIGTARAVRIYKTYGDQAIELIKANPYRLSADIWGIGFKMADQLATSLGIPRDSPFRAQAAVRHVLEEQTGNGHVGFPEGLLLNEAAGLTEIDEPGIINAVEQLRITDEVVRDSVAKATGGRPSAERGVRSAEFTAEDSDPDETPPTDEGGSSVPHSALRVPRSENESLIFLKPFFLAELGVARSVRSLAAGPHPLPAVNLDAAVGWVEKKMSMAFAPSQREAIKAAVTNKLAVVTGGPGTGKTTIVRAIIELFLAKNLRVLLTAPTGRAAKRLSESTGREAKTIHRLLEFNPQQRQFTRNAENPLDVDLLVVDETSMVDVLLMNKLLQAVPPYACVVLVGDVDQLPSVGAGAVLTDLIGSGAVPVARLTEVHRQAESSWIVRAAHAINAGREPVSAPPGGEGDFYFVEANEPGTVIERVVQMVRDRIPARFGLDPFKDVQVLSPQVKTALGVGNLNRELQQALNPPDPKVNEVKRYDSAFRVGDKVMQVQNNYDREVFNGDIGRITAIDPSEQVAVVDFDGRAVEYEFSDLDELQLSYACTIHKSQGSEYPAVVIPVHTQHFTMLQRNLLYTGVTRGRKLVALVGSRKALWIAVNAADTKKRHSLLRWRLAPAGG
ncbi:MAG: AAA family ATPase [Gemmataceae bacterium]|nr:AAA family ATPase [Gemmataceae bacterium]